MLAEVVQPDTKRRISRRVAVGGVLIGGGAPVTVQTMTKTKTADVEATLEQIRSAAEAGCNIVRVAVDDDEAAWAFRKIARQSPLPVVADVHFSHVLALSAIESGAAKIRINPGNIGSRDRIREVLNAARRRRIPIRIGVNSGSLEKDLVDKHGSPTAHALFESAMRHIEICREHDFEDIVVSVKSTSTKLTIEATRLLAERTDLPLHIGVTETGPPRVGIIKASVGIGALLSEGIGDTIRVTLMDDPLREVEAGKTILQILGLDRKNVNELPAKQCG